MAKGRAPSCMTASSEWSIFITKHRSQIPGSLEGVPCAMPHRSQALGDIGMLQRLHRQDLQTISVSEHFKGFIRTERPQVAQDELRKPVRG